MELKLVCLVGAGKGQLVFDTNVFFALPKMSSKPAPLLLLLVLLLLSLLVSCSQLTQYSGFKQLASTRHH